MALGSVKMILTAVDGFGETFCNFFVLFIFVLYGRLFLEKVPISKHKKSDEIFFFCFAFFMLLFVGF